MLHLSTVDGPTYTLLREIFKINFIQENFALAGGTALSLQIGHRKSIDLDIFSPKQFDVKELEVILESATNFNFKYSSNNSRMLFCTINNVKCDFINEPATQLEPFVNIADVRYFSIPDIAAMKLHTVCGRGKKKDFFDIYSLLELYSWEQMIDWFVKKYDESQLFFLQRSITYFQDADDDPEIAGIEPFTKNWDEVKKIIAYKCK